MSRADLSLQRCTIARAVALIGDVWTIIILREMFLGTRRFDDFQRQTGISPHLLSQRLKKLETEAVIRREAYSKRPLRHEYRLTEMGRAVWPVIISLKQWGDDWVGDGPAPVDIQHKGCGQITRPQMTCTSCGAPMTAHDATACLSEPYNTERQAARKHP